LSQEKEGTFGLNNEQELRRKKASNKRLNFFIADERCNNIIFLSLPTIFTLAVEADIIRKREQ
jgi:hypothetical protein